MEPMTARALLTLKLSPDQREKLREHEKKLPPGRYLVAMEILQMFNTKIGEVPEEEIHDIDQLYRRWERDVLQQANGLENERHIQTCGAVEGWCKCRTRQEEIHEWEDWILDNYDLSDDQRRWRIPPQTLARVAPAQSKRAANDLAKAEAPRMVQLSEL